LIQFQIKCRTYYLILEDEEVKSKQLPN